MKMETKVETISPATAREWLLLNKSNRPVTRLRVLRLIDAINKGQYKLTGEAIKFNGNGDLIDGQHRLLAVVESNKSVQCLVIRGLDSDIFKVIDSGKPRTAADVLAIEGYTNVNSLASAAKHLYQIERKAVSSSGRDIVQNEEISNTLQMHPDLKAYQVECAPFKFARSGVIVASLYWMGLCSTKKGDVFMNGFLKGVDLSIDSPIYQCREKIVSSIAPVTNTRTQRYALGAMLFRAFNLFTKGEKIARLTFSYPALKDYPYPAGGPYLKT